ncbi:MAG TPA: hypothetical protein VJ397_03555, partial [Thermoplasmata archaeon]|nr:hypothetical protein [Thermoplasmata archaeon]
MRILPCQVGSAWLVGILIAAGFGVLLVLPRQAGAVTFFSDSFDPAPMPGWTTSGAWHLANETADPCFGTSPPNQPGASASSPNSFGYHYDTAPPAMSGQACTYDLDDGGGSSAPNTGQLTSPPINFGASGPYVWLHFSAWRETEDNAVLDTMTIWLVGALPPVQIYQLFDPPTPQASWETIHVNLSTAAGLNPVQIIFRFVTGTGSANTFSGWYVDDVLVDNVSPLGDVVTITPFDAAPARVFQGDGPVVMGGLDFSVDNNNATVSGITVGLTGVPPADADVAGVWAWRDDGDSTFEQFGDSLLDISPFAGGSASLSFSPPFVVNAGTPERLWVTYQIANGATAGDFVGMAIQNESYVSIVLPDIGACVGCPFDTFDGNKTEIIGIPVDTLTVTPVDLAPLSALQGDVGVLMGALDLSVGSNTATLNFVTLNLTGLPPADADVVAVWLWLDDGDRVFNPGSDFTWQAGGFVGGTVTLAPYMTVTWGIPERFWITFTIDPNATVGDFVGIGIPDATAFSVATPDLGACVGCPFDTYVAGNETEILPATVDSVTFEPFDVAPPTGQLGDMAVMGGINLTVDGNAASVAAVRVNLTGLPPADADVSVVEAWLDDGDGVFSSPPDNPIAMGMLAGGTATLPIFRPLSITAGTPTTLWIVYYVQSFATVGDWIGLSIESEWNVVVDAPDAVTCVGCPMDTYSTAVKTEIVNVTADNVTWSPVDLAPPAVVPGDMTVLMAGIDLSVDNNSANFVSMVVNLTGVPPSDLDIMGVTSWRDDGDGVFDPGLDFPGPTQLFAGGTMTIYNGFTITAGTPVRLWFTYSIAPWAKVGDFVGIAFDALSVDVWAPDSVACVGCPLNTFDGSRTEIVGTMVDLLTFRLFDLAPATVLNGDTNVLMGMLRLMASDNDAAANTVTLDLTGL